MEKLPAGVVISVAFHAVVIACALGYDFDDDGELARKPAVSVTIVEVPPPVDVVLLPDEPAAETFVVPEAAALPTKTGMQRRQQVAIAATTQVEPRITTTEPVPSNGRVFGMRTPKQADLQIHRDFRDDLDRAPKGTTPNAEVDTTGKLQPDGGGTYRSDEGVFTAKVGKDGSVNIKDSKNLRFSVPNPTKIPKAVGQRVATWYEGNDKNPGDPERVAVNNNRSADKDTRPDHGKATVPILGGGFDVTDALLRRKGEDPYFSKKLKYLDSTRDERVQIGTKYRKQLLEQSTQLAQKNLDYLWSKTTDPAARKQGLFELWDDCAEAGDAAVIEAGRAARLMILGAIRSRFPAGSEHAFTARELAALNRKRHSKMEFAPYASEPRGEQVPLGYGEPRREPLPSGSE